MATILREAFVNATMADTTYEKAGVDTERADLALKGFTEQIRRTWLQHQTGFGAVKLNLGFFANVIDLGGIGLAISTDGVGSKVLVAQMMQQYDTLGIDCVAMNVNDLLCVGAKPVSMVDYIAIQDPNPNVMTQIATGLSQGARMANISISGGETAQLPEIVRGYREGEGLDLAGTAIGTVALDKILVGQDLQEGDSIVGIESNGIHSNGLTLARHVLFSRNQFSVESTIPTLPCTLGQELLKPTHIYVPEVLEILDRGVAAKAFVHVTSDGFLNLARVEAKVGFVLDWLPSTPPIFSAIQEYGNVADAEMFHVYNMGIGFCVIVSPSEADDVVSIVESHGKRAHKIGRVIQDPRRRVFIEPKGLVGENKRFRKG
jgi:phosphoribosylformylglycinamidine cyclo-ligase